MLEYITTAPSWEEVIARLADGLTGSAAGRRRTEKLIALEIEHIIGHVDGDEGNLNDEMREVLGRLRTLSGKSQPQVGAKKPRVSKPRSQSKPLKSNPAHSDSPEIIEKGDLPVSGPKNSNSSADSVKKPAPAQQGEYKIHPVALKFPPLPSVEFAALKESIRDFGQFEPIIIDGEGVILDGRHRYQVCRELGVSPITTNFADFQGNAKVKLTAEGFIFDSNMKRRHLTESQRSAIALEFANMRQGERTDLEPSDKCPKVSQEKAGGILKVSAKSVGRAKKVKAKNPETFAKVKAGDISLNAAVKIVETEKKTSWSATDRQEVSAAAEEGPNDYCEVGWLLLVKERDMAVLALTPKNEEWRKSALEFFESLRIRKIVTVS
jgi:hypothetical protein